MCHQKTIWRFQPCWNKLRWHLVSVTACPTDWTLRLVSLGYNKWTREGANSLDCINNFSSRITAKWYKLLREISGSCMPATLSVCVHTRFWELYRWKQQQLLQLAAKRWAETCYEAPWSGGKLQLQLRIRFRPTTPFTLSSVVFWEYVFSLTVSFKSTIWSLPCSLSLRNTGRHGNRWSNSHSNVFTYLVIDQTGKKNSKNPPLPPVLQ